MLVARLQSSGADVATVKHALDEHSAAVLAGYWRMADQLILKFADGGLTTPLPDGTVDTEELGFPGGGPAVSM